MKYQIKGEPMPVVICEMEDGESVKCEAGAMCWMTPNMVMETSGGGVGKMFGRMFSGETMFQNRYTADGHGMIAFASCYPGAIRAVEIGQGKEIVIQKRAFLAAEPGVELSVFFQKKAAAGFFGGEGFIMQKLSGNGVAFLEIDGSAIEYDLAAGDQILVSSGHIAMMDESCSVDVQQIKGFKNIVFGGEGLFNTIITGPGRVILQTMPLSKFANQLVPFLPTQTVSTGNK